jgi:hypothetical protein
VQTVSNLVLYDSEQSKGVSTGTANPKSGYGCAIEDSILCRDQSMLLWGS